LIALGGPIAMLVTKALELLFNKQGTGYLSTKVVKSVFAVLNKTTKTSTSFITHTTVEACTPVKSLFEINNLVVVIQVDFGRPRCTKFMDVVVSFVLLNFVDGANFLP